MNVLDAIKIRRSIRSFERRSLPPEVIQSIEDAILHSPSGSNAQESHFVIVQDPDQIRRIKRFAQGLSGDPAAVVVLCTNKEEALARGGLDTAEVLRFVNLGIARRYRTELLISLGYSNQPPRPKSSKPVREVISYDQYGKEKP